MTKLQFYDDCRPSLEAGTFTIHVEHTVTNVGASLPAISQEFVVEGPRFRIDPSDVHAVYPPENASGPYAESLPHIVMNKRVLPWERRLVTPVEKAPWMALLLFEEGELLEGDTGAPTRTRTMRVEELLRQDHTIMKPALRDVRASDHETLCKTIRTKSSTFRSLMPDPVGARYLAHCRETHTDDKAMFDHKDDGWFSVVIGNRFPRASASGAINIVHLVSLEGFEHAWVNRDHSDFPEQDFCMVSLASWSFRCVPESGESFHDLVSGLAQGDRSTVGTGAKLLRAHSEGPSQPNEADGGVALRLARGFVPLAYRTFAGEDTFAWYRGPLTPISTTPDAPRLESASAAMIYDESAGTFDSSYAVARQLGRALGLADRVFTQNMLALRAHAHEAEDRRAHPVASPARERIARLLFGDDGDSTAGASSRTLAERVGSAALAPRARRVRSARLEIAARPPLARLKAAREDTDASAQTLAAVQGDLPAIAGWIGRRRLLYDVPFEHLVPLASMLPEESIRFFYIDGAWLDALMDGALSVGISTSRDAFVWESIREPVRRDARAQARSLRKKDPDNASYANPADGDAASGLLIRSALVSGWPGLAVRPARGGQPVEILRMERIGPSVLLCLFADVPDAITLAEPNEGLCFGVDAEGNVELRRIVTDIGRPIETRPILRDPEYVDAQRIVRVGALVKALDDWLAASEPRESAREFGPADFAVQMVRAPQQIVFGGS